MKIYLHEMIRTVPGREEEYMSSVLSSAIGAPGRGGRYGCLGQFRPAETSGGFPSALNIWEHTWESQAASLARQFYADEADTALEEWWQRNLDLRRGGYDRWLVPTDYSPNVAGLEEAGVRGRVFWHEILFLPMGGVDAYLEALGERFLPAVRRYGAQLVGAYRVALRPRQALMMLAFREWDDLARLLEARESDPELRDWFAEREARLQDVEELILLPHRMCALGIRD